MSSEWKKHPLLYEINTIVWLNELTRKYNKKITLDNIPEEEFEYTLKYFDAIWLMGVWKRSPKSVQICINDTNLLMEFKNSIKNFSIDDIIGSPYAVYEYEVDNAIGSKDSLIKIKERMKKYNLKLILDFVPNHLSADNNYIETDPNYFLQGNKVDYSSNQETFFRIKDNIFAHGKDPYFPAWTDTIQVNAFSEDYRDFAKKTIKNIAKFADGVRCDMAMLLLDDVFKRTWGNKVGKPLQMEFWEEIISSVKNSTPNFKFFAEVYWNMEYRLQQQGFDYCYDKTLYDRMRFNSPKEIRDHLNAEWSFQSKLLRFIENHDEPRAIESFGVEKSIASAIIALTIPGAHLIHYGQMEGATKKVSVQLKRRENEPKIDKITKFYHEFIKIWTSMFKNDSNWTLLHINPKNIKNNNNNNETIDPIISFKWISETENFEIVTIVNYSSEDIFIEININEILSNIENKERTLDDIYFFSNLTKENMKIEGKTIKFLMTNWSFVIIKN